MGTRRIVVVALVSAVTALGLGLGTAPAGAAKVTITGSGDVTCFGAGRAKGVSSGTVSISYKAKLKATCFGSTGDSRVVVTGAKLLLAFSASGASCNPADLHGGYLANVTKWVTRGGKMTPTNFSGGADVTASGFTFPKAIAPGGAVTGSYASSSPAHGSSGGMISSALSGCTQGPAGKRYITGVTITFAL